MEMNTETIFDGMGSHFSEIAPKYKGLRTTDLDPIEHIINHLRKKYEIAITDVGCGVGDIHWNF